MNNPKTEEIVKSLRGCSADVMDCKNCVAEWGRKYGYCFNSLRLYAADRLEALEKELADERYRHDRLQDFCVAHGEQLSALKADMETATRGNFCDVCAHMQPDKNEHCARCSYENSEFKWRDIQVPEPTKEDANENENENAQG